MYRFLSFLFIAEWSLTSILCCTACHGAAVSVGQVVLYVHDQCNKPIIAYKDALPCVSAAAALQAWKYRLVLPVVDGATVSDS
jgi:hypothetical protein